jgi:ribosomal protein S18 acetylase RimI-like enzyme
MKLIFKQAKRDEFNEALDFFKAASTALREKNLSQWHYWDQPPEDKITWVKEGFEKGEFYFVYDEKDQKVGMFRLLDTDTLYWHDRGLEQNTRYVHSLVVSRSETGKGIGKYILLKLRDQLKKNGISKFRLDCDASNQRLCKYYEDLGFKKTGEKKTEYAVNNLYEMFL